MTARRTLKICPPNTSPRDSLELSVHPVIDSVLKDLKQCTRRLQAALASQHIELQVLEKLYYKGNNQHRTALFWRRVSDIRRFGRRLEGAGLHALVEGVRTAFWGNDVQPNSKVLKGPWVCYPDAKTVQAVLRRLIECHTLIRHMHEHVTKAHNHFNLEFQTGAFLQLILTLTAISSRIAILLTEIQSTAELACHALHKLLSVLHPTLDWKAPAWIKSLPALPVDGSSTKASQEVETPAPSMDFDEDIGMAISSNIVPAQEFSRQEDVPHAASVTASSSNTVASSTSVFTTSTITRTVRKETEEVSPVPIIVKRKEIMRSTQDANPRPKALKKKKPKKKDEIDDIFGF